MGLSPTQLQALKTELSTDPRGYGYAQYWAAGYDNGLRDIINTIRDGSAGTVPTNPTAAGGSADGKISRFKISISQGDVIAVIDGRDIGGISQGQAAFLNAILCYAESGGKTMLVLATQAGAKTLLRTNLDNLLGTTNGSQARLDALAVRFGSRAEEIVGTDPGYSGTGPTGVVTADDISACRKA